LDVGCTACDSDCGGLLTPFTGCAIVESPLLAIIGKICRTL
jgi:hypothetical protein